MVLATFPDETAADKVLTGLLEGHLAACVQIMPIQSAYRWKGEVQRWSEILMMIKTSTARYPEVEAFIRSQHAYEVPEIIRLPIADGFEGYLRWIDTESK